MARRAKSLEAFLGGAARAPGVSSTPRTGPSRPARILGIDPGSRYTGYGVIDRQGQQTAYVACGRLVLGSGSMPNRLLAIFEGLAAVIREHQPTEVAIEETFVNRSNAQSALVLGQARGVALLAAAHQGLPVAEYAAASVKLAVAGNGRADKEQIAHMVRVLLKHREPMAADAADALAVAICHAHVRGNPTGRWR